MSIITKNSQSGSPGTNLMLITALLLLIGIGGTYQFLLPNLKTVRKDNVEKKANLEGLQKDLATLQNIQQEIQAGEKQLANRGVNIKQLDEVFPPYENMPQMYIQIESLQGRTQGVHSSFQVGNPVADPGGGGRIPINFTASGTVDQLKVFLNEVNLNMRPIIVSSVSFNQGVVTANGTSGSSNGQAVASQTDSSQYNLTASGYVLIKSISDSYIAN